MDRKESRQSVLNEVERTLEQYCSGCFLYSHNRKERGRAGAHKFCLSSCTVGEKLRQFGEQLKKR